MRRQAEKAATGCSHGEQASQPRPFLVNPFEFAVTGSPGPGRARFIEGLIQEGFKEYTVAHVRYEDDLPAAPWRVQALDRGANRALAYPAEADAYVKCRPLFDADFALVEDPRDGVMPALVYAGSGQPMRLSEPIAYVAPPEACPLLPADAVYFADTEVNVIADRVLEHLRRRADAIPLYGLVLTGGFSTRMKRDKALLDYHGKPQFLHCRDLLAPYCAEVFVSMRAEQQYGADTPAITDRFLGFGPMGGILSALKTHPGAAWLVLACDLPFVDASVIETLLENRDPFKLATAFRGRQGGLPEPLCAIYEPKSVHRLLAFLGMGVHCPRKVLINSDTRLIDPPAPYALDNANSPEEYEAIRERLRSG